MDYEGFITVPRRAVYDRALYQLPAALRCLLAICNYTDEFGRTFVSASRLAADLGMRRQSVYPAIKRLSTLGYIVRMHRPKGFLVIFDDDLPAGRSAQLTLQQSQMSAPRRQRVSDALTHTNLLDQPESTIGATPSAHYHDSGAPEKAPTTRRALPRLMN